MVFKTSWDRAFQLSIKTKAPFLESRLPLTHITRLKKKTSLGEWNNWLLEYQLQASRKGLGSMAWLSRKPEIEVMLHAPCLCFCTILFQNKNCSKGFPVYTWKMLVVFLRFTTLKNQLTWNMNNMNTHDVSTQASRKYITLQFFWRLNQNIDPGRLFIYYSQPRDMYA